MGTKKGHIRGKVAPFKVAPQTFGEGSCPKLPPGSATISMTFPDFRRQREWCRSYFAKMSLKAYK